MHTLTENELTFLRDAIVEARMELTNVAQELLDSHTTVDEDERVFPPGESAAEQEYDRLTILIGKLTAAEQQLI